MIVLKDDFYFCISCTLNHKLIGIWCDESHPWPSKICFHNFTPKFRYFKLRGF